MQAYVGQLLGFSYLDPEPSTRNANKSIVLFLDPINGTLSLPRWADLIKGGRAGDPHPSQEQHCSQFMVN